MFLRCSFLLDSKNDWMDCEIEEKNSGHITRASAQNDVSNFFIIDFQLKSFFNDLEKSRKSQKTLRRKDYLLASSIATATATVIPTMGLLPAPMRPIISVRSGRREEKTPFSTFSKSFAP